MRKVWGLNTGSVKSAQCHQRLATAATFFRSCVAQSLSRGDGPRHSIHALANYREYNEDLIFRMADQLLSAHAIGAERLRYKHRVSQIGTVSPTACHRCDVLSELCRPIAKPRRWAPPLVTRFGVRPQRV